MPSNRKAKKALFSLIPPLPPGPILELGSGFGGIAIALAKRFPEKEIIAFEVSPLPFLFSLLMCKLLRINNLRIIREDFFTHSFHGAAFCYCYLYPRAMKRLESKFGQELAPNAVVISNVFRLPTWEAEKEVTLNDLYHSTLSLYRQLP